MAELPLLFFLCLGTSPIFTPTIFTASDELRNLIWSSLRPALGNLPSSNDARMAVLGTGGDMTSECDDAQGEGYGEGDPEPDRCLPKCEGKVMEAAVSVVLVDSRLVWGCNNNEVDECREPGRMAPLGPLRRSVISAEPCPRPGYLEEGYDDGAVPAEENPERERRSLKLDEVRSRIDR
jgi:hypothetical protein